MEPSRYRRTDEFEQETFEGDLVVMHRWTHGAVVLNPPAAALWEALAWPHSADELTDLMAEARPAEARESLRELVDRFLAELRENGLLVVVPAEG